MSKKPPQVMRFRITLDGIEPPIWRMIDVSATYSFWDLHVAIQDAMGWLDYHLHSFTRLPHNGQIKIKIGIPGYGIEERTVAGWEVPLSDFFMAADDSFEYEYDFGDGWCHEVIFAGFFPKEPTLKYPRCVDGQRACPPEDCGGIGNYMELLWIIADSSHEEHQGMVAWLKGHVKNYWPYKPDEFEPASVKFDNPKKRLKNAFPQL